MFASMAKRGCSSGDVRSLNPFIVQLTGETKMDGAARLHCFALKRGTGASLLTDLKTVAGTCRRKDLCSVLCLEVITEAMVETNSKVSREHDLVQLQLH